MNNLKYLTYQSFPAETANSLQTITTLKYFKKNGFDVTLIFPLREKQSNADLAVLHDYYNFSENIDVHGVSHNYPFGKFKIFESISFHISHYLWSKKTVNKLVINDKEKTIWFTRSDWILYFLAKKNIKVIFECHKSSKLRKFIIKKTSNNKNVKFIFLNKILYEHFDSPNNSIVLHNGVDEELFINEEKLPIQKNTKNKFKKIVFVGSLSRYGKKRNLDYFIDSFKDDYISSNFKFIIVGGPESEAINLREYVYKNNLSDNIQIVGRQSRAQIVKTLRDADIGLLTNNRDDQHSLVFTSPLKYFEYLYSDLIVLASDFPSHRNLPYSEKIEFFNDHDSDSFVNILKNIDQKKGYKLIEKDLITVDKRVKRIIEFYFDVHPEGLEPSTS